MALKGIADPEKATDTILTELHAIFGTRVFDVLVAAMTENYLDGKMDIRTTMIQRQDLFERAFIGILSEAGEKILARVCDDNN